MPNFIKLDSKPFHPDTYIGPEQEDEDAQHPEYSREKSMSIKLKVENTVRWRWSKDEFGQDVSSCISVALPYMRYPCFPLLGHLLTVCVLLIRNADTMSPFRGGNPIAES